MITNIEYHRVRSIIPHLNYSELDKAKILPKEKMFTPKNSGIPSLGGEYPNASFAKKLGPSDYGFFMEQIIETLLLNNGELDSLKSVTEYGVFDVDKFIKISEFVKREFLDTANAVALQPQVEWVDKSSQIMGHPDLVSVDTIYDIKTTGRFGHMRIDTILQLLCYYSLSQVLGLDTITSVGLILPLQLKVVTYSLKEWNWKPFYQKLIEALQKKESKEIQITRGVTISSMMLFRSMLDNFLGHHCRKEDLVKLALNGKPLQFFVSGNSTSKISYDSAFLNEMIKVNTEATAPVFIHAPYVLNLCHPGKGFGERDGDSKIKKELGECSWGGWTFLAIKKLLEFGAATGCRGVCVHVGKSLKSDYKEALETMRDGIIACSQWATVECPLLIETPAGQGTEVLCDPKEMAIFYNTLPDFVKEVTGICVDSCHSFSCGFNPHEYLLIMKEMGVPVKLIHYNDSKGECGCKKDRHAMIGQGYIGLDTLYRVLQYAVENNIPAVTE